MARAASIYGAEALAMRAISILDIALWDLKARHANLPLFPLLGGVTKRVPVLVPCGYRREGDSNYNLQSELQHYRDAGVTAVKTMFTPSQLKAQAATINQARAVLGNDILLGNDFVAAGANSPELLRALDSVTSAKLDFIEDPFPLSNQQEFTAFRQNWKGLLMTGETVSTLTAAHDLCNSGWINAARFDATVCGGVTAWMRMHALATARHQPVWPHCFPEIHAHLAAATGAPFVESPLPTYETVNFAAVLSSPLPIAGGFYELPNRPGLGLDLNDEKLHAMRVNEP
jgi:D-arabinonate dehydratase